MVSIVLLFLHLNTLYLTYCDASDSVAKLYTNLMNEEDVTETQHTICKIATDELVATARATVTRVLTGACNAKTIDDKLQGLQKSFTKELEEIKELLYTVLENKKDLPRLANVYNNYQEHDDYNDGKNDIQSPRQLEIDSFNNTIQDVSSTNGSTSFFFYYWQIKSFDEKLARWKTARSERSSTFYVGQNGYAMYIKVTPRYFPDGTVFIGVGLTRGRHDSILKWPFPHKIRLEVLDHSFEQLRQDRRSRIWDPSMLCSEYFWGRPKLTGESDNPECVGLSISRQVLFSKPPFKIDQSSRNTRYLWNVLVNVQET
ncbi:uncharacterized protein LOC117603754 isoform X2 [Osmia lignaria lignaria]|uniref:uncharacterized protein LOC117603754 isoform X2 n=1 Tax=Osmia lignaria lignaria TaxID=1437193 RepID=UPI001478958F|nr:uncharacterized protein LOC117603754 isoform X2 [Osmia lignaria]